MRKRREKKPIPAAATAVELAGYKTAELMDNLLDLYDDFREWGKVPFDFRFGGLFGMLFGKDSGIDLQLPPLDGPEDPAESA